MIKPFSKHHSTICLISAIGMMFTSASLRAEEPVSLSTKVAEGTKSFLSDPAQAGSLVGTILAGAAIANPLAPILGSVVGFFVGKKTDYTKSDKAPQNGFARRSFIPSIDSQVASLSGLAEKPEIAEQSLQSEQMNIIALIDEPVIAEPMALVPLVDELETGNQSQTTVLPMNLESPRKTVKKGNQQQLALAHACNNVEMTQQIPIFCYYYSQ